MLNTRSFSDILIDQILEDYDLKNSNASVNTLNAGWESTLDPFGMAQILAQTQTHSFTKANRHNPYNVKAKIKTHTAPIKNLGPSMLRKAHNMNEQQLEAYAVLKHFAAQLPENFDLTELKTAYRRSVLKAHPDQGGTSETFQNVKKSYQILTALVK